MEKIRYGIVGAGIQGMLYINILYNGMENSTLSAISTTSKEKVTMLKEKYENISIFDNYKDMILSGEVDAIITTCPSYFHTEIAEFAITHGVHVLGEKPAGVYGKSVTRLNEIANRHKDISYAIFYNNRTNTIYQNIKKAIESAEYGEFRRLNWIQNSYYRVESYYKSASWRASYSYEGGGLVINQAVHTLDLIYYMSGQPTNLYAKALIGHKRDITTDSDLSVIFEYENGATGAYIASTHDMMGTDRLEIDFSMGKIVVENKVCKMYKFFDDDRNVNKNMTMDDLKKVENVYVLDKEIVNENEGKSVHTIIIENFSLNILKKEPLIANGIEGIKSVEFANAISLSSHYKKEVPVPVDEDEYLKFLNEKIAEEDLTDKRYS